MNALGTMILHNTKPDFKDKRMVLASLVAPIMLPVPCSAFPANVVYERSVRFAGYLWTLQPPTGFCGAHRIVCGVESAHLRMKHGLTDSCVGRKINGKGVDRR